jgi:hypothetical protein
VLPWVAVALGIVLVAVAAVVTSGGKGGTALAFDPIPVETTRPPIGEETPTAAPSPSSSPEPSVSPAPVVLTPDSVSASGSAPTVTGAGGNINSYEPEQAVDGVNETAWCVPGDGAGQFLQLEFSTPVLVSQIGIVPGYDKIDPVSGVDRFAENRKIVTVRYAFSSGSAVDVSYSQDVTLDQLRQLQVTAIPTPESTTFVRIEPVATTLPERQDRDYTCISEALVTGMRL